MFLKREGQILLETKNGCKVSYVTILIIFWLFMKLVFISINIHSSPTVKTSKNVVKNDVSKYLCNVVQKTFLKWRTEFRCLVFYDPFRSQYLFEILHTLFIIKNSENVVKSGCFEKTLRQRVPIIFRN